VKSILDPTFRYTPSFSTDIRKTFARARRESRKAEIPPVPQKTGHGTVASIVGRIPRIPARGA
jgi:hypothetical protein